MTDFVESPRNADHQVLLALSDGSVASAWAEALASVGWVPTVCADVRRFDQALTASTRWSGVIVMMPLEGGDGLSTLLQAQANRPQRCPVIVTLPALHRHRLGDAVAAAVDLPVLGTLEASELPSILVALLDRYVPADWERTWRLDAVRWELTPPGREAVVPLTYKEVAFLTQLAEQPGRPFPREAFTGLFTEKTELFDARRLEVMVRRLRDKVRKRSGVELPVNTAHGVGYAFATPVDLTPMGGSKMSDSVRINV